MSKDQAFKKFTTSRNFFSQASVRSEVVNCSLEVCSWMLNNKCSTDRQGNSKSNHQWLPLQGFDLTNDETRLDLRRAGMRKKLFSHGLRRMLNLLISKDLVVQGEDLYEEIANVTGFRTMALHEELVGYKLSPIANGSYVALKDLSDRFDMPEDQGTTRLRDRIVVPMSDFGLLDVETDDRDRYYIRSGFVAETFHKNIFSPLRAKYEPLLEGETVQQAEK